MKKIYLLGAICALAAAVSCENETELPEVTLDYAKGQSAEIIAPPQGGEVSLGFKSSDVWDVTTVVNWLEFDKLSGKAGDNTLTVTVDENADLEGDRSGEVRIHCDNKELIFTISQLLSDKLEAAGETSYVLDAKGGSAELKFSATKEWTAKTDAAWLTLSKTSGGAAYDNVISIEAPVNISAPRTAQIEIVCGEAKLEYTVSQDFIDGVAVIGSDNVTLPELGGEAVVKFSAVAEWTAVTEASWLTLSAAKGAASAEVSLTVSAGVNVDADRTAQVKVSGGNKEIVFTVSQKMATSTLAYTSDAEDAGELYVLAKNGAGSLDFIAVENWTAATDADWVTIGKAEGETGTFSIEVTAEDNTELEYREAVVTITSASGKSTLDFTIYQNSVFGDYCGIWTATGVLTTNSGNAAHSEPWLFADSEEEPGNGGMKGLLGETKYWGSFMWDAAIKGAKIATGADNVVNMYNFTNIGVAAIAPMYRCTFQTEDGEKSLVFETYINNAGAVVERPVYCLMNSDNNSMSLAVFTYDQYPNPTKMVATSDFELTYGLYQIITDDEGNPTGEIGDFMGYTFGGTFKVTSVTRGAAATAAINAAVSKVNGQPAQQKARRFSTGGNIRTISADQLVKCERADLFIE